MRNKIIFIFACIAIGLFWTTCYQLGKINRLEEELVKKDHAVSVLESDNYTISFKKNELADYIKLQNTAFKIGIDSVCKQYDIKIKDLNRVIQSKNSIIVKDTVYLPAIETKKENDSLYVLRFFNENKCISASVRAISKDSNTKINFEKLESKHEAYSVVYKEPKKWWQIFKKRKLIMKTFDNCGEITIKELTIE